MKPGPSVPAPPPDAGHGRALSVVASAAAESAPKRSAANRFAGHALEEQDPEEEGRVGVLAAVAGLGLLTGGGGALWVAVLLVGWWMDRNNTAVSAAIAGPGHDVGDHNTDELQRRVRPSGLAVEAVVPLGPQPAPVTVELPSDRYFHEMEVVCGGTPYRARAPVRSGAATVRDVPPGVVCEATFKGSEPVLIEVRAGDHKRCTLQPTVCTPVR